ncbi:MAG: choice-of-anchor J domain-containing protein, partial [Candidatus Cloacimonadaceae bacterium]|nr:choice-of-anchor J domain-containing protein [Candidatus Cloacimonadaceae bacterium]
MFRNISKSLLMLIFAFTAISGWALVSDYTFTSSVGTYTEISGGTVHGDIPNLDNESFMDIPLGFTFNYNGVNYTSVSINANGFLAMGPTVASSFLAISAATGTNNVIAAMNRDLLGRDDGQLMSMSSGTAPNRVFTVQWKNYRRFPTAAANDVFNFQIQLHEAQNQVKVVYGSVSAVNVTTAQTVQVGLRGGSNEDYNNRTTTTDWTDTTAGTAATSNCRISATVFPPLGLTFSWVPAQTGTPPNIAQNPVPVHNAVNVNILGNLSWANGGGAPTGYKVYFGTNNPPTNIANGLVQTGTTYASPNLLAYGTTYYWKIVPFNDYGDALDCPVWQFSTVADPTITTFPHTQNFDTVTPPALPLGWMTINANNDVYTWESIANNPSSAPNAMRIRYNQTVAMNDWLITPPMVLNAVANYRLVFKYRVGVATSPEKLALYLGTAPNAAAFTVQLFDNPNMTNTTYQTAEVFFTPTANGTYFLGFHGYSNAAMQYIYVDDFMIEEITESWDPPINLAAAVQGNTVNLTWEAPGTVPPPPPPMLSDSFETYPNFALTFDPWTLVDVDLSGTYGITGTTWANAYSPMAYMIFNPSATTPPMTTLNAHSGQKMAASFASTSAVNNDWLISPLVQIPDATTELAFFARSYVSTYGLERFKVGISTGGTAPANFTIISGASYIQAPVDWTEYTYSLAAYAGQSIRFAIQCVSDDAFIFFVDDV